jgi:energy-coupling factor transporter ATP-binding protein EcfA2
VSGLSYRHDSLKGEVKIKTSLPGYAEHLHQANFNFSSTRAKSDLVKILAKICKETNWDVLIEQLRVKTLQLFREGSPLHILNPDDKIEKTRYILYPLIPKNHLSLIYGEGGTGKSTLALFLSLLAAIKDKVTDYGFVVNGEHPYNVLYLDYETEKDTIGLQFKHLCNGLGMKASLFYRRCNLPLAQDLENIKEHISSISADLVITDSVGIACGGDLNEAHTANLFTLALRSLKTTNFVISHTSKDRQDKKTPFGSVYFYNNACNIWEIRKTQIEGDDLINIGHFHRKSNISKLHKPIGLRFIYQEDSIIVESENISEIGEFEKELSLRQRIKNLLLQEGVMTIREIAGQLNAGEQVVRSRLNEMRNKGDVIKQGDKYAMHYE